MTLVWRYPAGQHGHARLLELLELGVAPFVTYALLHAGPLHVLCNVLFLRLFGGTLERLAGRARMLWILLAGVVLGALGQLLVEPMRAVPMVGISAGVFALAGAYFARVPRARVLLIVPVVIWPVFVELPAWLLGLVFAALQVPPILELAAPADAASTAWPAHAAGLLVGVAGGWLLVPRPAAKEAGSVGVPAR